MMVVVVVLVMAIDGGACEDGCVAWTDELVRQELLDRTRHKIRTVAREERLQRQRVTAALDEARLDACPHTRSDIRVVACTAYTRGHV